ncbi:SEN1 N terminal-domain-containing protein [Auriculariales sp. MPI-PUGE-AT-0066]|nr:SEN1 N terminal-domain-containing protein [Auriculariales sp. MPI-PUGE-AT-0066]
MPQPPSIVTPKSEPQFAATLEQLRDNPVGLQGIKEDTLHAVLDFVLRTDKIDGRYHLFCNLAKPVWVEAATFILRIYAYQDSSDVKRLRARFAQVLSECRACVQAFQARKWTSRRTYLGCFDDKLLDGFFDHVDEWEKSVVLAAYKALTTPTTTLHTLPPALVFHCVANPRLLADENVWNIFATCCQESPGAPFDDWPKVPQPGLFLLLTHQVENVRSWAATQLAKSEAVNDSQLFTEDHRQVLAAYGCALLSEDEHHSVKQMKAQIWKSRLDASHSLFWKALQSVLQYCPDVALKLELTPHTRFYRALLGHLNDEGDHFFEILLVFEHLLRRLQSEIWTFEGEQYPLVALASVKDNRSVITLLEASEPDGDAWFLAWIEPFLLSLWNKAIFSDALAKLVNFLCEELQHERFKRWHPMIVESMAKSFLAIVQKASDNAAQIKVIRAPFDIHAKLVVNVSLARNFGDNWSTARQSTRSLLAHILRADIRDLETLVRLLASRGGKSATSGSIPPLIFGQSLWELAFRSLRGATADAVLFILPVIAQCSALNELRSASYQAPPAGTSGDSFQVALTSANRVLGFIQGAAEDTVEQFVNSNPNPRVLESMLSQQTAVSAIVSLLCSPAIQLQKAAKSLLSQTYGVDATRSECFRAVLERSPEESLKALIEVTDTFTGWATELPEACSMAQVIVLCLVDVLEALCSRSGGLLFTDSYLYPSPRRRPSRLLPKLWKSMCRALAAIFSKTPGWSSYYDSAVMVVWMRDALIFGRDLIAFRGTLETAVQAADTDDASFVGSSPRKGSEIGKRMVTNLQPVLKEVIAWLRLTDQELLYQSHALLRSLLECFRSCGVSPDDAALTKLGKFVQKARQNGEEGQSMTRLSAVDLAVIEEELAYFTDDIIIMEPPPTNQTSTAPSTTTFDRKRPRSPLNEPITRKTAKVELSDVKDVTEIMSASRSAEIRAVKQSKLPFISRPVAVRPEPHKAHLPSKLAVKGVSVAPVTSSSHARPAASNAALPSNLPSRSTMLADRNARKPAKPAESSDSSASDSEDGDDTSGLAGLAKLQKSPPRIRKSEQRRTVKMLDVAYGQQHRRVFQDRTNERERAARIKERLQPNLAPLHLHILSWDFNLGGDSPPMKSVLHLERIPREFESHQHYFRVLEPLLLHESWSQLQRAKEEPNVVVDATVTAKCFVNEFIDLDFEVPVLPPKWYLAPEIDVVLLRHGKEEVKSVLAKVQAWGQNFNGAARKHVATLRILSSKDPAIQHGSQWKITKVLSLSTLHREFGALCALQHYDLFEDVLRPRPAPMPAFNPTDVRKAQSAHQVNEPQARAILASTQTDGFLLVQGPPGTGKTWTICGMVGAFLTSRPAPATVIKVGQAAAVKPVSKKLLICAPSNAAIDEVAKRLRDGVLDGQGRRVSPKIVRVGIDASVHVGVKDLTLDYLVDQKLAGPSGVVANADPQVDISALRAELVGIKAQLEQKFAESAAAKIPLVEKKVQDEIAALKSKRFSISQKLDNARDRQKSESRTLDAARRKFRSEVLLEADVICSTLAGSGHETLEALEFETVIIDEAAQAIELSSLIPLRYGAQRCVMVGDPQQLPPTVLSPVATRYDYNKSLFVRIHDSRPDAAHLLSIQYRMHPDISVIPSKLFYGGRLANGDNMATKTKQPWHSSKLLGTYRFFNVHKGVHESAQSGHSLINRAECEAALGIYEVFLREFRNVDMTHRVGIISMYKAQIGALKRAFETRYGQAILGKIDFNTVDGFQGQEKDVIILSCVRAGQGVTSIGFLKDQRRLNVSITRSRSSLFILGHADTLQRSDDTWKTIVEDARTRAVLLNVDRTTFAQGSAAIGGTMPPSVSLQQSNAQQPAAQPTAQRAPPSTSHATPLTLAAVAPDSIAPPPGSKRAADEDFNSDRLAKRSKLESPSHHPPTAQNPGSLPSGLNAAAPNTTRSQSKPQNPRPRKPATSLFIPKSHQKSRP